MRVAITGTTGRVGRALADRLRGRHQVLELPRGEWDLAAPGLVSRIEALDFDVLLNPAAITSLEACEDDPALAERVNAAVPAELAESCRRSGRVMVHFSTDYVLGGADEGLHGEDVKVNPLSVYGSTKAAGERAVLDAEGCVIRVSWVFGPERPAFPEQVVSRALAGEPLAAVADKTSLPCFTKDLAGWIERLLEEGIRNELLHACNAGEPVSWNGMAEAILDQMVEAGALAARPEVEVQHLDEVSFFRATRPRHTAMATGRLASRLGEAPRHWREAMREHVAMLLISR
ncbi:dTDP-4-dehydrorhamnose reductase [Haloferula helveola]|uniref:dTDP-4-dehydrorhamnose reductase n=1 Tax=Haloferula helveola TaxID=490095 RepID=A0ABM7RF44_9BACT|nr:dTDP-4-dehydrorhamnose reductase [Haloferula helveola]